jgi:hypothetical protein
MAKSDSRFEFKANLSRTDFDLGQRLGLTAAPGMLLPVWFDFASPGDSYYMQHDLPLLRSSVLAAPAMVDVKVHFETFFVPMQMLYQPFENTMFSLQNTQSSFYDKTQMMNNNFPLFDFVAYISSIHSSHETDDIHADAFRLADLFGLNGSNFLKQVTNPLDLRYNNQLTFYAPNFFPWQLLAYNTIKYYYSGYFLDDKSDFHHSLCNWDQYYNSAVAVNPTSDFMTIHQRPWDFDYFMSLYRSPIVSDSNMQSILPMDQYQPLVSEQTQPISANGSVNPNNTDIRAFSQDPRSAYVEANQRRMFATAMIRQMFANEKLAMITGRTKKNYDSQVLAHYGVHVPHDVKHDITMIHHDVYDLQVQEVTSLATTLPDSSNPGTALGELAGKSYAVGNGKQFKFEAPCHGVVMTIFSIEPKKRYYGGFDRINAVTDAFDYPTPEFDRLGNVPMYRYEDGCLSGASGETFADPIGWKERYYQNKRKYDKCTLAFGQHTTRGIGVNNYSSYMIAMRPFGTSVTGSGSFRPRPDLEDRFYIERNALDNLCLVEFQYGWLETEDGSGLPDGENWSVNPHLVYARDPFIVNSSIKCKKVSWMSKDGEPIYNY